MSPFNFFSLMKRSICFSRRSISNKFKTTPAKLWKNWKNNSFHKQNISQSFFSNLISNKTCFFNHSTLFTSKFKNFFYFMDFLHKKPRELQITLVKKNVRSILTPLETRFFPYHATASTTVIFISSLPISFSFWK